MTLDFVFWHYIATGIESGLEYPLLASCLLRPQYSSLSRKDRMTI